ncbi:MAG TPA: choice-of-anchor tandem repeat GloVer-containing protein [Alphaproteobacteria bacterium]|nr:choice-of-anchor tandem repeat GloVer-containing protein [Alphaproteobacteria bacterium]
MFSCKLLVSLFIAGLLTASVASAATIKTLHEFTGPFGDGTPGGGLTADGTGMLYGVSDGADSGTIFSVDPSTGKFTTVHKFTEAEGVMPVGPLVPDGAGGFYGITYGYSDYSCGPVPQSIYRFDVAKRTVTVLYPTEGSGGGGFSTAPVLIKGALYGKYEGSGRSSDIYRFDLATRTLKIIGSPDSRKSRPNLITCSLNPGFTFDPSLVAGRDGRVYGATIDGRLLRIDPATNRIVGLHALSAKDGGSLSGPLTAATDGTLYGTTAQGGLPAFYTGPCSSDCNAIFKFEPAIPRFTILHRFTNADSVSSPEGTTALSPNGKFLYGTTISGGPNESGALYRLNVETKEYAVLHVFTGGRDGAIGRFGTPGLKFARGSLFGITINGGKGYGTVFQVIP